MEPASADDALLKDAAGRARDLIKESYASIRRGRVDGLVTLLSDEAFVLGPGPADVFTTRTDAVLALQAVLRGKKKHQLVSRGLVVVASPSGRAAWATDSVLLNGRSFRVLYVLEEVEEIWSITVVHIAADVPSKKIEALAAERALPELVELRGSAEGDAQVVAELAHQAAAEPEQWLEQLAEGADVMLLGTGARDAKRGSKSIRKLWQGKKRKPGKLPPVVTASGRARAQVVTDGSLAWVAMNGTILGHTKGRSWPSRLFAVYTWGPEGWQLVLLQLAVAPKP